MIGLGLRQLQEAINRKADRVQREFIATSERLKVIGLKLVESREEEHDRLLAEQTELRERQLAVAEQVNQWRERAREVTLRGEGQALRDYLAVLLEESDASLRPVVERTLQLLDTPEDQMDTLASDRVVDYRQLSPATRLIERARTEYDLRGSDPALRQRAAAEFATRRGMAQDETALLQIEAALDDVDPIVREVAALTLIQLHRFRAMNLADLEAAHESVKRLVKIDHPAAIPPLVEILANPRSGFVQGQEDRNSNSRMVALTRLIEWHTAAAQAAVLARRFDLDPAIVRVAVRALELFPGDWSGPLRKSPPAAGRTGPLATAGPTRP